MYICNCHGIRERDVRAHIKEGADTVGRVFKKQGCKPDCAKCANCIKDILEDEKSPSKTLFAAE